MKKIFLLLNLFSAFAFSQSGIQFVPQTNVTGVAPIVVTNNTVISIPQASALQDGFLSATNWSTFNSKMSSVNPSWSGIMSTASTAVTSTVTGDHYFSPTLGHVFNITDNNSNGLTVKNGTNSIGIYCASSGSQFGAIGSVTGGNWGVLTNFGSNQMSFYTNGCQAINKPTNAYATPVSLLEIRANSTSSLGTAFSVRNNADVANVFSITDLGSIAQGTTVAGAANFRMSKTHTGGTITHGIYIQGEVQPDVTNTAYGFRTGITTGVGTWTMTAGVTHFATQNAGAVAGGTVTQALQTGFDMADLFSATTNYGYRSRMTSGANKWSLYLDGNAQNYMAGAVGIGTTTPASPLHVIGVASITGGISVASTGAAPLVGTVTLVGGTATVSTTKAVTGAFIFFQRKTAGGTTGTSTTYTVNTGVSFTITSDNVLDTSTFNWWIINP